jgi:hypothetical protein
MDLQDYMSRIAGEDESDDVLLVSLVATAASVSDPASSPFPLIWLLKKELGVARQLGHLMREELPLSGAYAAARASERLFEQTCGVPLAFFDEHIATPEVLRDLLRPWDAPSGAPPAMRGAKKMPGKELLFYFLVRMRDGSKLRNIYSQSHMSISTAQRLFKHVLDTFTALLEPKWVEWPDTRRRAYFAVKMGEKHGLPGCIGWIDGTLQEYKKKNQEYYTGRRRGWWGAAACPRGVPPAGPWPSRPASARLRRRA